MLDRRSDYVPAVSRRSLAQTTDSEVVCFSAAGGKDDLVLLRANERRHFTPRAIDRGARLLAEAMDARCVAKRIDERARHHVRDARIDRCRGAMIQVNSAFRHQ